VGIDTLWMLPQDIGGDTSRDWDLQVCPDWACKNGLKAGVHGSNAVYPFGIAPDTGFETEHHFQFIMAVNDSFRGIAPAGSIFGGMMFVRSRTTGKADTVLGFGAWRMDWDTAFLPPVHPVYGYLPKRSDFMVAGGKVRYTGPTPAPGSIKVPN
jgi:hypothetical protein